LARIRKWLNPVIAGFLCFVLVFTGIPFAPGGTSHMLSIPCIGLITVAGFLAEVGDFCARNLFYQARHERL
jgi:hypothetical protein